jgi:hypothetical protein
VNTRELNGLVAEYERIARGYRQHFDGLTVESLDEIEELADSDAPAALVAERLGVLATWQQQLRVLSAAVHDVTALRPYLADERAAWQAAYARTNEAFTGWYFDGWAIRPDSIDTTGETER